jgi:hypothetical protein
MAFPSYRRLVGVISGMIIWAIWFVVVYSLTGIGCDAGWHRRSAPGGNLLSLVMLLSTALALALIAWTAWRGYLGWRRSSSAAVVGRDNTQRQGFMGLVMMVLSILAAVGTLLVGIPILMLEPCAA